MKILIVDDEPDTETLFQQKFRKEVRAGEHELLFSLSGEEALQQNIAAIDVMLIDVNMPGMSGLELADQIRSKNKSTKLFLMTGLGDQSESLAREHGCNGFFGKPIDFERMNLEIFG